MYKRGFLIIILILFASLAAGQTYYKIGDEISIADHRVKIIDIGSVDALFDVNGKRGSVTFNDTIFINGVNITVKDIFYHADPGGRLVWAEFVNIISTTDQCDEDSDCDDGDACTLDRCTGQPRRCDYEDSHFAVNYCLNNDGCCPTAYCGWKEDSDCPFVNKFPCQDASDCRDDRNLSTEALCIDGLCEHQQITDCKDGDGYCPDGCFYSLSSDQDCNRNNKCVWNSDCDDGNPCTIETGCRPNSDGIKECMKEPVTFCVSGDRCCPSGCSYPDDQECSPTGEINIEEGGTVYYECKSDAYCDDGLRCIEGKCVTLQNAGVGDIFSRIIELFKKLFLPGG